MTQTKDGSKPAVTVGPRAPTLKHRVHILRKTLGHTTTHDGAMMRQLQLGYYSTCHATQGHDHPEGRSRVYSGYDKRIQRD